MTAFVRSSSAALVACALALASCSASSDPTPPAPPDAPASLTATPFNAAVALSWTASARAESYKVYQSATSGQATTAMTLVASGITGTSFNAGATNDVLLYYRVTAVNSGGESAGSPEASATATGTLLPAAPVGLTATAGNQSVTLSWDDVPGATSYAVYRSTSPGVTTAATLFTTASSSYVNAGLTNGLTYYYAVAARIGAAESALSAEVAATPVVPPPLPYIDASAVMLPPAFGFGGFQVQVCTDANCTTPVPNATVTINETSLTYDGFDTYEANATASLAGAMLQLVVTIPSGSGVVPGTYTAAGTMYTQAPLVTSPSEGAVWLASQSHTISWTPAAPTSGSTYAVAAINLTDFFGSYIGGASATSTSLTVPANSLTPGNHMALVAISSASGPIPIPNTLPDSGFTITASSGYTGFTVE